MVTHDHSASIRRAAALFEPITLAGVGRAELLDRVDTKFLLPVTLLPEVLAECSGEYYVLEVNGTRISKYTTLYFDTTDLEMYRAHQSGRSRRSKVRLRRYVETDQQYLEVKLRTNKGRTVKSRVPVGRGETSVLEHLGDRAFSRILPLLPAGALHEVVAIGYMRITLVGKATAERVTLDTGISFSSAERSASYPALAVAELKQSKRTPSHFLDLMRSYNLRHGSFSKYCLAIVALNESAKTNRYKQLLQRIENAGEQNGHASGR